MNHNNLLKFTKKLEEYRNKTFEPGTTDCNIIAVDIIDEICKTDLKSKLYKKYQTIPEGLKKAKSLTGCKCISEFIAPYVDEIEPELSCTGDLIVQRDKYESVLFHMGATYFEMNDESGLIEIPSSSIFTKPIKCYRIKEGGNGTQL